MPAVQSASDWVSCSHMAVWRPGFKALLPALSKHGGCDHSLQPSGADVHASRTIRRAYPPASCHRPQREGRISCQSLTAQAAFQLLASIAGDISLGRVSAISTDRVHRQGPLMVAPRKGGSRLLIAFYSVWGGGGPQSLTPPSTGVDAALRVSTSNPGPRSAFLHSGWSLGGARGPFSQESIPFPFRQPRRCKCGASSSLGGSPLPFPLGLSTKSLLPRQPGGQHAPREDAGLRPVPSPTNGELTAHAA